MSRSGDLNLWGEISQGGGRGRKYNPRERRSDVPVGKIDFGRAETAQRSPGNCMGPMLPGTLSRTGRVGKGDRGKKEDGEEVLF